MLDELIESLRPLAQTGSRPRATGWRQIADGAQRAAELLRHGTTSDELLGALVGALDHEHPDARSAVVRVLADVDRPQAREALRAELLRPGGPASVQRDCLAGLRGQVESAGSPAVRAARRWSALDTARLARDRQLEPAAAELHALAHDPPTGLLVEAGAFEVADLDGLGLKVRRDDDPPGAEPGTALVTAADRRAAGPDWEQKYRFSRLDLVGTPAELAFTPTTWRDGHAFHLAMRRVAQDAPEHLDRLAEAWLTGGSPVPGIAAVHVLVLTADDRVVLARRNADTPYAPGRWSASIEEQLTSPDAQAGDAVQAAARRGVLDELGTSVRIASIEPLSLILEMPALNLCPVLLVSVPDRAADLLDSDNTQRDGELVGFADLAAAPDPIERFLADTEPATLHPTTTIRLRILLRRLQRRSLGSRSLGSRSLGSRSLGSRSLGN